MSVPAIETERLSKRYWSKRALQECSLSVARGESLGILGSNGSGKTTLIRLLMGFLTPTTGVARIEGLDTRRQTALAHQHVSYLPGQVRLFPTMHGRSVLRLLSRLHPDGDFRIARKIADRLGIDLRVPVSRCSTGMRQKIGLAAVLSRHRSILILDEPTTNLDPDVRGEVMDLLVERKQSGQTIVLCSHLFDEVQRLCDRAIIFVEGRLIHEQAMDQLRSAHRIQMDFDDVDLQIPASLSDQLRWHTSGSTKSLVALGALGPILAWLADQQLPNLQIEPFSLESVYHQVKQRDNQPVMQPTSGAAVSC